MRKAPLRGDAMSLWLYPALTPMNGAGSPWPNTLMPEGTTLDLLVTTTDYDGYDRQIAIADPPIVHDGQHRHVLRFSQADGPDRFGANDDVSLAAVRGWQTEHVEPLGRLRRCGLSERLSSSSSAFQSFAGDDPHHTLPAIRFIRAQDPSVTADIAERNYGTHHLEGAVLPSRLPVFRQER